MVQHKHKFEDGDLVYEITRPQEQMLITKHQGSIYYCRPINGISIALAYMERDLKKIG